jgi:hypothetical protein
MGGMGGGIGPMGPGGGMQEPVYNVPWRLRTPQLVPPPTASCCIGSRPGSRKSRSPAYESRAYSPLRNAVGCDGDRGRGTALGQKLLPGAKLPIAVLATPDGTIIGKAENKDGYLRAPQVEKLVDEEHKWRENLVESPAQRCQGARQIR